MEERAQEKAEAAEVALVTGKRTVGDAAANEKDGNIAATSFAEEVRPDLGFENNHDAWANGIEHATHAEGPVEREIEDCIGEREAFAGESLAGDGGSREN